MTDHSGRVIGIFTEAIQLPVEERDAFLNRACAGDDELRWKIEALLRSNERAGGFLEQPPGIFDEAREQSTSWEKPGDTVDRYKLLEQIGEGGCGVVFVAEQQSPVLRRVALKVIKPGMDSRSVIARFEAERQALALMDHPNIAHVFDAGTSESGRPYFVMELVGGARITDYCDRHSLSTRARLELFVQVCDAIEHAHQKGIIHRDIKPSNILVTTGRDGKAMPKVIDFGIAKATTGQELTDKTIFTSSMMLIGTPAYMSPEQATLSSAELDTRTDIYSLGVLLYELLTGKTPFDTRELLKAGFDEVRRVIRDEEPARPSTRLRSMVAADLVSVSKEHGTQVPKLIREMRGDLDWIVMKALEKDRKRRYATTTGLAMDIGRYLSGEAVLARPPSTAYKFRKLLLRNRLLFGSLAMVAAMFVIGFVAVTVALTNEKAAHLAAEKARWEAVNDKVNSDQVAVFLGKVLEGVGPMAAMGKDRTLLKQILDKTVARLDGDLKNMPEVQGALQVKLAWVYREMRQFEQSEALFRKALATAIRLYGEESETASDATYELAMTLSFYDKQTEAEACMRRALAVRQKLLGEENVGVAKCYEGLSLIYWSRRQVPEAEAMARKSLTMLSKLFGDGDPRLGDSLLAVGSVLFQQGKYRESEEKYRQAMTNWRKEKEEDHPTIANCKQNLGSALSAQGKYEEAETLFRQEQASYLKVFGEEHPSYAQSLQSLTRLLNKTKRYDEAEVTGRKAFAMTEKAWGHTHPKTLEVLGDWIAALRNQHKFEEVERMCADMLPPGWESKPEYANLLKERLNCNIRRSRWREAAADATLLLKHLPDDHEIYHAFAPVLVQLGDLAEYQKLCRTILDKFSGTTDMSIADRMAKDCLTLPVAGVDLKAVAALADQTMSRGATSSDLPFFQFCKGLAEFRLGHHEEALKFAGPATAGPRSHLKASAFAVMAMSQFKLNRLDEARKALSACHKIVEEKQPKSQEDPGSDWREWITVRALHSEAKQMIEGESSSAAPPAKERR
jgi:serine/threonine protein kinase/tetratricopeptide (TPR) repeat protein